MLKNADFMPYIIFIAAPSAEALMVMYEEGRRKGKFRGKSGPGTVDVRTVRVSFSVYFISRFTEITAGVPVYLAPWTGCPPGGKPTMDRLPPGGQPVPGYPTPHPGYLHPRGATYPGWFILPPGGEDKPAVLSCPPPMILEQ